jgi:type IV secretory pathway VirB2 component (pilin)
LVLTLLLIVLPNTGISLPTGQSWARAVDVLITSVTGPVARSLSLVAIVVGGLMFAFGEGSAKRALAGIVFGVGMAIAACTFMVWLFN